MGGTWFQVDLKEWRLDCTHYAMKNGGGRGLVLDNWNFEAKVKAGDSWTILRQHRSDRIYASDNSNGFGAHVFEIEKKKKEIGRAVQQECRDRSRMPSSA
eukprot:TRINITY_DN14376_c0_g1_i13.p1 TRINITY_DN14376_c0_g1~~TRINITY_DN14376_c0_g1_i13.p1  ORF type:complete len:100 (+),score=24.84 TRINITY_DN14376_c0_g1_i13:355-654(+)